MKYSTFLKKLKTCPFCDGIKDRILAENDGAILSYSQAPYHKYHLLVTPKRHVKYLKDLAWDEDVCVMALLVAGIRTLDKFGHKDCSILMRDGVATKTIQGHLHYHIIPGGEITDISLNNKVRKMLTDKEEAELKEELKEALQP